MQKQQPKPKASWDDYPIVTPPSSVDVTGSKVLLYRPDETPLTRKVGF